MNKIILKLKTNKYLKIFIYYLLSMHFGLAFQAFMLFQSIYFFVDNFCRLAFQAF